VRGKFWVVADRLTTDRPRHVETLWHWHPANQVQIEKSGITSTANDRGNLAIIPVGAADWKITQVKGQETPSIQGWYSKEYNKFEPNPTTIYSRQIKTNDAFVWILWPSEGKASEVQTELLSKDNNSVSIRVSESGKGHWDITVPFMNSQNVQLNFIPAKNN
jgi:hypothetical protein